MKEVCIEHGKDNGTKRYGSVLMTFSYECVTTNEYQSKSRTATGQQTPSMYQKQQHKQQPQQQQQ